MRRRLAALLLALPLAAAQAGVEVNQASEADLDGLSGLGPATTRRILAEREQAPFRNWADLLARVKGLGPANARKLSAQGLTVYGESLSGDKSSPPARP